MTDKEKLYQAYYEPDRLWTGGMAIKELQDYVYVEKRYQIMVNKTSTFTGSHTTSKRNKSSSL